MTDLPHKSHVTVLWAQSDRYQTPQFVAAWSEGLVEAWHEWYLDLRDKAMEEWRDFGHPSDGPWTFWVTQEDIPQPSAAGEPIEPANVGV